MTPKFIYIWWWEAPLPDYFPTFVGYQNAGITTPTTVIAKTRPTTAQGMVAWDLMVAVISIIEAGWPVVSVPAWRTQLYDYTHAGWVLRQLVYYANWTGDWTFEIEFTNAVAWCLVIHWIHNWAIAWHNIAEGTDNKPNPPSLTVSPSWKYLWLTQASVVWGRRSWTQPTGYTIVIRTWWGNTDNTNTSTSTAYRLVNTDTEDPWIWIFSGSSIAGIADTIAIKPI